MIKTKYRTATLFLFSCLFSFVACVDTFKVSIDASKTYLIVDGIISDLDEASIDFPSHACILN